MKKWKKTETNKYFFNCIIDGNFFHFHIDNYHKNF